MSAPASAPAFSTSVMLALVATGTVYWLPPEKSMPRTKPLKTMIPAHMAIRTAVTRYQRLRLATNWKSVSPR